LRFNSNHPPPEDGFFFMQRVLIFANGRLPDLNSARSLFHSDDHIIGADGGTRHALNLGLTPNVVVGDLDSLTKDEIKHIKARDIQIILYPRDKNETDLELALDHALELKPDQIVLVGALGERLDQTLANIALISGAQFVDVDIRLDDGVEEAFFCRDRVEVHGRSGDIISLIPWQGAVEGVQTEGLRWPLRHEKLYSEKSRGISNEMMNETAQIQISSGLLLIIHRFQSGFERTK
jgi:thiamine pyrophosphokinase